MDNNIGNDKPLVSVIIPTYQRYNLLPRAIESVLNQTYSNIEIVVVDDNSPESPERKGTEDLMKDYLNNDKIKYIKHPKNLNGSAARNTGIKNSNGKFLAFLDDDDEFFPTKIEKQVLKLEELDESWGGCYCNYVIVKNRKIISRKETNESGNLTDSILLMKNAVASGSTLMIRKDVVSKIIGYDESFVRHQDWEFLLRFFQHFKLAIVSENLVIINYDSRINEPSIQDFIKIKNYFLVKFEDFIAHSKYRNDIYFHHFMEVAFKAALQKNLKVMFAYIKKAKEYGKLKIKSVIRLIYLFLGLRFLYLPVILFLRKLKNGKDKSTLDSSISSRISS